MIAIASKTRGSGKKFPKVYADYVQSQDKYAKECTEYNHIDHPLALVPGQIEGRIRLDCTSQTQPLIAF